VYGEKWSIEITLSEVTVNLKTKEVIVIIPPTVILIALFPGGSLEVISHPFVLLLLLPPTTLVTRSLTFLFLWEH
jgi:hypothetical protein